MATLTAVITPVIMPYDYPEADPTGQVMSKDIVGNQCILGIKYEGSIYAVSEPVISCATYSIGQILILK